MPLAILFLAALAWPAEQTFRLEGRIEPEARAAITLYGSTAPFNSSTLTGPGGRFEVKNLLAGTYTLAVFLPNRGEIRQTIEVGPGTADERGTVAVTVKVEESRLSRQEADLKHKISARQLSLPEKAKRAYADAQKRLEKREVEAAVKRLQDAVKIAPDFVEAWNFLGTIYYQTQQYPKAEQMFRTALEKDPEAYSPLVNLGGVLLTLNRAGEALPYNLRSVVSHPEDALANSQLGMNYFLLGNLDSSKKYLLEAKRLDPAHFSLPQWTLAQIYVRTGDPKAAAAEMEEFIRLHPDSPDRERAKAAIEALRR